MAINNQVDTKLKLKAVREYVEGNGSLNKIAEKYGVCRSTLQKWFDCTYQQIYGWVRTYHSGGLEKLCGRHKASPEKIAEAIKENKRLKKQESALELEWAVHCRLQQCHLERLGEADFSGTRNLLEYQVIAQMHQEQGWPVGQLCKAVGVSRAAYYKWKSRTESQKQSSDEQLASLISEIYQNQHGIPGYRQMKLILERLNRALCLLCVD